MISKTRLKVITVAVSLLTLAGCGGGSGTPANNAPIARAGADQSVDEFAAVILDGRSSSDADAGDTLTYAWTQTAGTTVTITNASTAQAGFDAPDVTAVNTPDMLTFQLAVSDGSRSSTDTVTVTVIDVGLGANSAPTANAGGDQTVGNLTIVTLDGTGSMDPDGDAFTYAWLQMAGTNVTLTDASVAQPSFTAPDATMPQVLTFQLTVDDGTDNATDSVDITVQEALSQVIVAGKVSYEFVLPNINCGLDFNNIETRPIRAATVQLLDATNANAVLGEVVSGDDGAYSFADIAANTDVRIRVRARLQRSGSPSWKVEVRENVEMSPMPPPWIKRRAYGVQCPVSRRGECKCS